MTRSFGKYNQAAQDYISSVERGLHQSTPRLIASHIRQLVEEHDDWRFRKAISFNAAENILSKRAQSLLASDMATRVSEGFPGARDFPAHHQNRFFDEIEATVIGLAKSLFKAKHVEWRPVSTSMANATVFFSLLKPNDLIFVQPEECGGNYSYNKDGPPRAAGLRVAPLPFTEGTFEVDLDRAVQAILRDGPAMVVVGGSNVLFPYPLKELRIAADRVGAILLYDAAHVSLLNAAGLFQDPLAEGAHIVTMSAQKILSGPVGGFILTNDDKLAAKIYEYSFPALVQTRDENKFAASAHALAEMAEFGKAYAGKMVNNAYSLAGALETEGFQVVASNRGYTMTHQIFAVISQRDADDFEDLCQKANLLVTRAQRMGSDGIVATRLTSQEITRRGMTESDMPVLAQWLRRVIVDREPPSVIAGEIEKYLERFPVLHFSYDE